MNKKSFLQKLEAKWKRAFQRGISEVEAKAYDGLVETIFTQNIQEINDLPLPSSWAEVTALKILFPDDFFSSRHAAVAQKRFPKANIGQWKFNDQGPTTALGWKTNKYRFPQDFPLKNVSADESFQGTAEMPKRSRPHDATKDIEEEDNPLKKRRLDSPSPVEDAIADPGTPEQATPPVQSSPEGSSSGEVDTGLSNIEHDPENSDAREPDPEELGDSENSNEFWSEFDDKLASIRKAAKEGTEITPRMLNQLRKAHQMELKQQHPDKLIKKMMKQHARELRQVRARYEGVITTWLKGVASGVKVLQRTRQEISNFDGAKN